MLEDLLDQFGDGVSRRATKLLENGQSSPATMVSIRVKDGGVEHPDTHEYGLRVDGLGSSLVGVRQNLGPQDERAHLGASLIVRHDGEKRAIVDWSESMAAWGVEGARQSAARWKMVDPPEEGRIDDGRQKAARKRIERGEPVEVELLEVTRSEGLGGLLYAWDLRVRTDEGEEALPKVNVPEYAVHLLVPSARLTGAATDKGTEIDWHSTAAEFAATGKSTGFDFDRFLPPPPEPDGTIEDMDAWMAEFDKWKEK